MMLSDPYLSDDDILSNIIESRRGSWHVTLIRKVNAAFTSESHVLAEWHRRCQAPLTSGTCSADELAANLPDGATLTFPITLAARRGPWHQTNTVPDLAVQDFTQFVLITSRSAKWCSSAIDFVKRSQDLEAHGLGDLALDLIYDSVDTLLSANQFALLSSLLFELDVTGVSIDILLALLVATLPAKSAIGGRSEFLQRVAAKIESAGLSSSSILAGLE